MDKDNKPDTVLLPNGGPIYRYAYKDILGKSSPLLRTAPEHVVVHWIKDGGNGWSQVKYGTVTGWMPNNCIDLSGLSKFKACTAKETIRNAIIITDEKTEGGTTTIKKNTKYTLYCKIEHGKYEGKSYIGIGTKRYYI